MLGINNGPDTNLVIWRIGTWINARIHYVYNGKSAWNKWKARQDKARDTRKQTVNILKTTSSYIGSIHRIKILKNKH